MTNSSEQDFDSEPVSDGADAPEPDPPRTAATGVTGIGIGAIAQEIGLTKDTLRVWERRYGFPQPMRSPGGERLYPQEQVTKLRDRHAEQLEKDATIRTDRNMVTTALEMAMQAYPRWSGRRAAAG